MFLQVRTPSLPLARAACVGVLGLGLAGICGAVCPDQHFLHWFSATGIGTTLESTAGSALSAMCLGGVTTLFFGGAAALVALGGSGRPPMRPLLPAAMLLLLLSPGVALQSPSSIVRWVCRPTTRSGAGCRGRSKRECSSASAATCTAARSV